MLRKSLSVSIALLTIISLACAKDSRSSLARGFQDPPDSAKPRTWWHWVSGNVSKEGITADLEAMKRIGVGGAQAFSVDQVPDRKDQGHVLYMTPEWRDLMKHAISECNRLGLELTVHACEGWSESGGPWITPEYSMQKVVWTETTFHGPGKMSDTLAQPETIKDFYRDICVLAFPALRGEQVNLKDLKPKITSSEPEIAGNALIDGKLETVFTISAQKNTPVWVQFEFPQAITVGSVGIAPVSSLVKGEVQVSDDGKNFRKLGDFSAGKREQQQRWVMFPEATGKFFRVIIPKPSANQRIKLAEISFGGPRVGNFRAKAAFESRVVENDSDKAKVKPDAMIAPDKLIDLTSKMDSNGNLNWDAPEGDWTILRIGHTSTGHEDGPAMAETRGLECDKLSREAVTKFFNKPGMISTIIDDSKPLVGKSLQYVLMDSWEAGQLNWTEKFREEFKRLRGYDPQPWLPALTGRYVKSPDDTERFLWDFRRTIADLIAENHYGLIHDLLHQHDMKLTSEAPGIGMPVCADELQCKGKTDIPMGEFWVGWTEDGSDPKEAASAAHIYGKTIAAAESFTATPENAAWKNDPYSLKMQGDREFCVGINRYVFHRYAHQPWLDRAPGMTMGPWGINFERTNTWWEPARAWISYISRCEYLLQQGLFVADLAYMYPEGAPENFDPGRNNPKAPAGHDFDGVNAEVVMTRMSVKNGMIVLPDGMSYRVLVLPNTTRMTPALLTKVKSLVEDGATVVGPKPTKSPSLNDYPKCDQEVKQLADSIWGNLDGKDVTERQLGKGRIVWGKPLEEVLSVEPDFEATSSQGTPSLRYIHRRAGDTEIYFVSNQTDHPEYAECTFRVDGKLPELWYADSGKMELASAFSNNDGRTTVPLRFDPSGSVFVIFSKSAKGVDPVQIVTHDSVPVIPLRASHETAQHTLEIKKATYGVLNGDTSLQRDVTKELQSKVHDGTISVEASNDIAGDPAVLKYKQLKVDYVYDGKPGTTTIKERSTFAVPTAIFPFTEQPAVEIASFGDGKHRVTMWENGYYQIRTASGKVQSAKVMDLPEAKEITGSWQINFPPKKGAPATASFDKLISWTDSKDDGVKYFSGTATYVKDIDISNEMLGKDRPIYLDLGEVKNLAEVSLNGKNLGILWKPPFRIDITSAAHAGKNHLEVKVTNLWPNRLIGDLNLPADQRTTWTAYNPYKKDSPLLPSGILGPVKIGTGKTVEVSFR